MAKINNRQETRMVMESLRHGERHTTNNFRDLKRLAVFEILQI